MTMKECKDYIETELSKGVSKSKIEKYLKDKYREGLWEKQLEQYPEHKNFIESRLLNNIFFGYAIILFILEVIALIVYFVVTNPKIWPLILLPQKWLIPLLVLMIAIYSRKGFAWVYIMSILYPFLRAALSHSILDFLVMLPFGIIAFILLRRLHPGYRWSKIFRKKWRTKREMNKHENDDL